ncbi:hypothetical protein C8R45DRAFT_937813 [Mycena sanguinolenta]|nr:hypothetical protein C8R45DRAFT_937813 [Mycena sanguinolenta]
MANSNHWWPPTNFEKWLISWFRKNPTLMLDRELRPLLLPAGPILEALGGEPWFENRKNTTKTEDRRGKDCQRSNWKNHKSECRLTGTSEIVVNQQQIERLKLTDPQSAKRAADWSLWCLHAAAPFELIHALGLHRNSARGRTHIVLQAVKHAPTAAKLKHKFKVVSCGVFRIGDVLRDIETVTGIHRGGVQNIMGLRHDPDWRKGFNVGSPPGPMILPSEAKDVEHVF